MHKYIVQAVEQNTSSTLLITLKNDQPGPPLAFQPGQYAVISYYKRHRPSVARCFSIVSSPTEQDILQFSMRSKGHYTRSLAKLKPGDEMEVRGPFGGFVLNTERDSRAVLLAGGIGITPFMSMIRYAAATNASNDIDLIYSCQKQDDVPFVDELKRLQQKNPHFKTTYVIGEGPVDKFASYHAAQGRISPELLDQVTTKNYANTTFFICGPPPFMKAMRGTLLAKGVQGDYIMTEAFSQGPHRQTGKVRNWPFNMYALTATGVGLSSFVVMASDLLKTMPPSSIIGAAKNINTEKLSNSRQVDLDGLVNRLPDASNIGPESEQVKRANLLAQMAVEQNQASTKNTATSPAPSSSRVTVSTPSAGQNVPSTSPSPTAVSPPAVSAPVALPPTPPPPPPPKCKTTQSGVVVC